jgi:hypothetical protein
MPPATTTQPSMCRSMPRVHKNTGMMRAVCCNMACYGLSSGTSANVHIARHMFMNSKLAFVRFIVSTIDHQSPNRVQTRSGGF